MRTRLGFESATLDVSSRRYTVPSINYGDGMTPGKVYGNAPRSTGRTIGRYEVQEGTLELYLDDYYELQAEFGDRWFLRQFQVTAAYTSRTPEGDEAQTYADTLVGCRFTSRAHDHSEGGEEALKISLGFEAAYIRSNGIDPLPAALMNKGQEGGGGGGGGEATPL